MRLRRASALLSAGLSAGLASQGWAFDLCHDRGDALAQYLNGEWQMQSLGSRVYRGDGYRVQGDYGAETVTLDFAADGTGTITTSAAPLKARLHDQGGFPIAALEYHLGGLTAAFKETTKAQRAAVEACDMRNVPQFSAEAKIDGAPSHIELVAMGTDLFVGAQVITLPGSRDVPETKIVTALLMRRSSGGSQ